MCMGHSKPNYEETWNQKEWRVDQKLHLILQRKIRAKLEFHFTHDFYNDEKMIIARIAIRREESRDE